MSGDANTVARFTRMDEASEDDWKIVQKQTWERQPQVAETVLNMLRGLEQVRDGFAVDQLTHALQTASRAEKAGARDELVLAALCHDVGKAISVFGHAGISAGILRPYVSEEVAWVLENHQAVQGRHYAWAFGFDPDGWKPLQSHPSFDLVMQFVDEWDQTSFDPGYPTPPLARYEPLVRDWLAKPLNRK